MSKLSVSTGPCIRATLISNFCEDARLIGVSVRGVLGVLTPMDGVLDVGVRRGDGVLEIRNFWVANLLAAGDIVLKRSIVDLGDGLNRIEHFINFFEFFNGLNCMVRYLFIQTNYTSLYTLYRQ